MAIATTTIAMIGAGAVAVSNAAANIWNASRIGKMKKEFKKNQVELRACEAGIICLVGAQLADEVGMARTMKRFEGRIAAVETDIRTVMTRPPVYMMPTSGVGMIAE